VVELSDGIVDDPTSTTTEETPAPAVGVLLGMVATELPLELPPQDVNTRAASATKIPVLRIVVT
jgi:hypothetical protein